MALRDTLNSIRDFVVSKKKKAGEVVGGALSMIEKSAQNAGSNARKQVSKAPQIVKTVGNIGANLVVPVDAAKQFGASLSKPFTNRYDLQALKSRQDKANSDLQYAKLIKIKKPELSRQILEKVNTDLTDIGTSAGDLAKSQPTTKQVLAQAGNLALQTALSGSGLKAAGQGIKALSKSKGFVKPILKSAGIGAAAGGSSTALDAIGRGETDAKKIAKDALFGTAIGGTIGGAAPVVISGATKLVKNTPKIANKVSKDIVDSLENPKFEPGFYAGPKAKGYDNALKKGKTFKSQLDGNRKFEGDDSKARLNKVDISKEPDLVLDDVLDHDVLYKEYPKLRDIQVKPDPVSSRSGAYDPKNDVLYINPKEKDKKGTILHEVQHIIQKEEEWPGGVSPVSYAKPGDEKRVRQAMRDGDFESIQPEMKLYLNNISEFEARDVANRMNFTPKQRAEILPYTSEKLDLTLANSSPNDILERDSINSSYEKGRNQNRDTRGSSGQNDSGSMGKERVKENAQGDKVEGKDQGSTEKNRRRPEESPEEVAQRILAKIKDSDEPFVTPKEVEKRKSTELFPDLPKTKDVRKEQRNDEARAMLDEVLQKDPSYREKLLLNKIPPIEKIQGLGKNNAYDPNVDIRGERLKLTGKALDMSDKQLREQVAYQRSLNKEAITPKKFDNFFNEWIGKRQSSEAKGIKEALKFKNIPEDKAWEIVRSIESGTPIYEVNPEIQDTIKSLREAFNIAREQGVSAGVDIGYLDNYITHIWEEPTQEVIAAFDRAKQKFKYSKDRNIMSYDEGIKLGLTPKYNNPNQILGEYVKNLNSSIADIQFINGLKDNDLLVEDRSLAQPGWLEFSFPGLVGGQSFWAPEKVGNTLKKVLDTPPGDAFTNTVGVLAKTSGVIQDIALSGGLPTLPVNAFTLGQSIKEVAGLRFLAPLQAGWRAFNDKSAKQFFQKNIDSIIEMQEQGIPVSPNINIPNLNKSSFKEWLGDGLTKDKREKVAAIWSASINDPTFKRFMPIMQVQFYNDTKAWFKMRGRSDIEAQRIAGEATKAWYGVIPTYDRVRRTQISDDFVSTVMFAPKYRESMIRFWYSIPRSVTDKLLDPAYETSRKFLIGASLMYIGYNALNKEETGKDMWDNPTNDKWNVIMKKPGGAEGDYIKIPFLPSVATIPRALYSMGELGYKGDFAGVAQEGFQKFSSMLLKPFADVVRNKDYFENEIYDESAGAGEKLSKATQYIAGEYMPSAISLAFQTKTGNDIAQKVGLGMNDEEYAKKKKDWVQLGLEAIEAPVRFTNKKKIDGAYYFDSKDQVLGELTPEERDIFKALHPKNKLSIQEMDDEYLPISEKQKKISEYQMKLANPNILQAETEIARKTSEKTGQPLDPLYALTPGQQRVVLTYQSIIPGEDEKGTMIQSNPWIKDYWKARSAFFDTINPNQDKESNAYTYNGIEPLAPRDIWLSKPIIATDDLQAKLDTYFSLPDKSDEKKAYIDNHPELSNYLEAKGISNNLQRLAMGIPLKEDAYSKYARGSKKAKLTALEKEQKKETKKNLLKLSKIKSADQIKIQNTPSIRFTSIKNTSSNKPIIKLNKTKQSQPKKIVFNGIQIKKK